MGFALQNANASRILQIFGADVHELSWFWVVAPLTGLIVQPIIGYYSDRTWTKLGRRRPYFLVGALLAAAGLVLMPNAGMFTAFMPALWVGAGMLMIMDASFNVAMEPFRALVADILPSDQRTLGFSVQTILIGVGAVIGSWLPYVLTHWFGVLNETVSGEVPLNLLLSFIIGASVLVVSILVTVFTTKEYSPEENIGDSAPLPESNRLELFNYVESELLAIENDLPTTNSYGRANKSVGRMLLAKLYLNAEVYTGTPRYDDAATYISKVIDEGGYSLSNDFVSNFSGDNYSSTEIIYPLLADADISQSYGDRKSTR